MSWKVSAEELLGCKWLQEVWRDGRGQIVSMGVRDEVPSQDETRRFFVDTEESHYRQRVRIWETKVLNELLIRILKLPRMMIKHGWKRCPRSRVPWVLGKWGTVYFRGCGLRFHVTVTLFKKERGLETALQSWGHICLHTRSCSAWTAGEKSSFHLRWALGSISSRGTGSLQLNQKSWGVDVIGEFTDIALHVQRAQQKAAESQRSQTQSAVRAVTEGGDLWRGSWPTVSERELNRQSQAASGAAAISVVVINHMWYLNWTQLKWNQTKFSSSAKWATFLGLAVLLGIGHVSIRAETCWAVFSGAFRWKLQVLGPLLQLQAGCQLRRLSRAQPVHVLRRLPSRNSGGA